MFKAKYQKLIFFIIFIAMYTLLDSFNMSYTEMTNQYGLYLAIINISINLFLAYMSASMLSMSADQFQELKGANLSFVSIVFGIFTYGCTPCVIAFMGTLGITFSVAVLPLGGLPYKLVSVALIIIGYLWTQREIKSLTCEIPSK